ncbi:jerky protein homolog-like [Euwallacea fornicatus]|uniref:jerky protein homolog-like n=1 Tax=Euwallacea fornicatus TaxID=995702 RepID=UPI00338DFAF5
MEKRKHITLSIKQKGEILDKLRNGVSGKSLALQYGVETSTISDIKKNEGKKMRFIGICHSEQGSRKTLRQAEYPEMEEEEFYTWFIKQRNKHIPFSYGIVGAKARQLFQNIYGKDTFVASRSWLLNKKKRYGLRHLKICGEKLSNDESAVTPFIAKLRQVIEAHDLLPQQIYNADESGLFWKLLPDKTLVHSNEAMAPGRKSRKERITFLACTNGDGTQKLRLLVIGKAKNPRPYKNKTLPVEYVSSSNA